MVGEEAVGRIVLGRYRIVRRVAKGGMGVIFLARNEGAAGFVRPVIVKQILPYEMPEDEREDSALKMFEREARITSQLRHPNIVSILDFREEAGAYYMVLEYVHGRHVGHWRKYLKRRGRRADVDLAVHVTGQVLSALHHAHTLVGEEGTPLSIVHRDVTPSNILIDVEGTVKLTDFGIARIVTENVEFQTQTPTIKGKFPYLAPELLRSGAPTVSTDLYSVGVSLHELLVGRNEFRGKDVASTVTRVLRHTPTPIEAVRRDIPDGLGDVVRRALAHDPSERFGSAQEFLRALRQTCDGSADERTERLREAAREDFFDEAMVEITGIDLDDLDRAWRHMPASDPNDASNTRAPISVPVESASSGGSSHESASVELFYSDGLVNARTSTAAWVKSPLSDGALETRVDAAAFVSSPPIPPPSPRFAWLPWLAVVASLVATASVVWAVLRPPEAPVALVVEKGSVTSHGGVADAQGTSPGATPNTRPGSAPNTPPSVAPNSPLRASPDAANSDVVGAPNSTRSEAPGAAGATPLTKSSSKRRANGDRDSARTLTRAFAKRRASVERCFNDHRPEPTGDAPVDDSAEVWIRFEVGLDGGVVSAELLPDALAKTRLGACILGVAKATRFGPQKKDVSFRIPIRVRRDR
ncbi:MAG: serine/threonine protein kinase [Deltaproteobacteria bacterium]|nr:serine/threonine protein kinase [Deltaproteobacteria bacterium]